MKFCEFTDVLCTLAVDYVLIAILCIPYCWIRASGVQDFAENVFSVPLLVGLAKLISGNYLFTILLARRRLRLSTLVGWSLTLGVASFFLFCLLLGGLDAGKVFRLAGFFSFPFCF